MGFRRFISLQQGTCRILENFIGNSAKSPPGLVRFLFEPRPKPHRSWLGSCASRNLHGPGFSRESGTRFLDSDRILREVDSGMKLDSRKVPAYFLRSQATLDPKRTSVLESLFRRISPLL
jgi:hypothetical protein